MNTRALLLGAVASCALAANANAAVFQGWYVGLEAGGNWIQDADVDVDAPAPLPGTTSFDTGWAALGTIGYSWQGWRGELELGYRANDISDFVVSGTSHTLGGELNELSPMLNVVYDFDLDDWGLSFGAGAGGDNIRYKNDAGYHTVPIHDTDWVFAWQAIVGLNYHLNSRTDLFVDYRYFTAENPEFTELEAPVTLHTDSYDNLQKHTATIGIRYALWGQDNDSRVEVAPPPPPPTTEASGPPKEFIVFFGHNKTNLVAQATRVIHEAAEAAKQYGSASISVVGHADRSGSNAYNEALSLRRAKVVRDALAGEGVPQGAMSVSAKGESEPLVPTADGVREPQNRRVNINM